MSLIKEAVFKFMPRRWLLYFKAVRYIRHVGQFSEADEPELKVVKHLVNLGGTVVDVGANVGWYTHYLSRLVGEKGRVISLEPMPETFWLLSMCVKWHRLSNATLVNVGASEEDKVGVMEVPFYDFGGENFYMAHVVDENIGNGARLQRQVRLTTLDSVLQELADNVMFVKCDVEGHELAVVKGAVGLIGQEKAAWLMEVSRASDPDIEGTNSWQIFKLFKAHRYTPWWFDGQRLRQRKIGDRALNYFFLLPAHVSVLERSPVPLER
ncbi:MAG: FkbM family methyltransferase [Nitrospira sp.]|nr:FkbM family methyltransferase [Nitrospira sp.]